MHRMWTDARNIHPGDLVQFDNGPAWVDGTEDMDDLIVLWSGNRSLDVLPHQRVEVLELDVPTRAEVLKAQQNLQVGIAAGYCSHLAAQRSTSSSLTSAERSIVRTMILAVAATDEALAQLQGSDR